MSTPGAVRPGGPPPAAEAGMRALLDEVIREITGSGVALDANFFEAGLTSASLVRVHERLLTRLSRSLPVSVLFKYPNRRALAEYLAAGPDRGDPGGPAVDRGPGGQPAAPPVNVIDMRRQLRARLRQSGR